MKRPRIDLRCLCSGEMVGTVSPASKIAQMREIFMSAHTGDGCAVADRSSDNTAAQAPRPASYPATGAQASTDTEGGQNDEGRGNARQAAPVSGARAASRSQTPEGRMPFEGTVTGMDGLTASRPATTNATQHETR